MKPTKMFFRWLHIIKTNNIKGSESKNKHEKMKKKIKRSKNEQKMSNNLKNMERG